MKCRCRTAPRNWPPFCSTRIRASACWTPAPRPAQGLSCAGARAVRAGRGRSRRRAPRTPAPELARLHLAAGVIGRRREPAGLVGRPAVSASCWTRRARRGVIRRHPDINSTAVPAISSNWRAVRRGCWPDYGRCSRRGKLLRHLFDPARGKRGPNRAFLADHADAAAPLATDLGHARPVGVQLLPGEHELDGFYYACLQKRP